MAGNSAPISDQELKTARADFVKDDFDRLVEQKGLVLIHEITYKCSCIREINGSALSHCPDCGGGGYVFDDPYEIKGVIQAINYNPKFMQYSEVNVGTAMLTTRYTNRIGWRDRITVKNGETIFMENIFPVLRTVNGIQELSALLNYSSIEVIKVFMNGATTSTDTCKPQVPLVEGTDFTVDGRKFKLSDDIMNAHIASKCDKAYVSIRYLHHPQYLVMDIQKDIRNTNVIENEVETFKEPAFTMCD